MRKGEQKLAPHIHKTDTDDCEPKINNLNTRNKGKLDVRTAPYSNVYILRLKLYSCLFFV